MGQHDTAVSTFRADVVERLEALGDTERAMGQQRYTKSVLPYHGVAMPDVRRITKHVAKAHPFAERDAWEAAVLGVWRGATHREQLYVATQLAAHPPYRRWLDHDALSMIEEMIVTGAWWDHVDALATTHVWVMLQHDRDTVCEEMWAWATDPLDRDGSVWRRRTAIICQLKAKDAIDLELLVHALEASIDSSEFFLRKAIGWALRQHARTDPDMVLAFVERHIDDLSPLSRREALKHFR